MPKPIGWDERDYKLWSEIRSLQSYGLLPNVDFGVQRVFVVFVDAPALNIATRRFGELQLYATTGQGQQP